MTTLSPHSSAFAGGQPIMPANPPKCRTCAGEGRVATDSAHTPWSQWTSSPLESALAAVVAGIVRPIDCPECHGTGEPRMTDLGQAFLILLQSIERDVVRANTSDLQELCSASREIQELIDSQRCDAASIEDAAKLIQVVVDRRIEDLQEAERWGDWK